MPIVWFYGIYLFFSLLTFNKNMDDWNKNLLINEFYQISVATSVISYYDFTKEYKKLALVTKWSLVFIIITAIMSIVTAFFNPMYARDIIGVEGLVSESEWNTVLSYKVYGGGGYGTAIAFMGIIPLLFYYYKNKNIITVKGKYILFCIITILIALLSMQIFANILLAILVLPFSLVRMRKRRKMFMLYSIIALLLLALPKPLFIDSLNEIANLFTEGSELHYKFRDFARFFEIGASFDPSTGTGGRALRYPMLWESFVQSPFMGCYFLTDNNGNGYMHEGGHLFWMNKLTVMGLLGLLLFGLLIYYFVKKQLWNIKSDYKYYYLLAIAVMLSYGLIKAIAGREVWYMLFIILPGLYYLNLLKRGNEER